MADQLLKIGARDYLGTAAPLPLDSAGRLPVSRDVPNIIGEVVVDTGSPIKPVMGMEVYSRITLPKDINRIACNEDAIFVAAGTSGDPYIYKFDLDLNLVWKSARAPNANGGGRDSNHLRAMTVSPAGVVALAFRYEFQIMKPDGTYDTSVDGYPNLFSNLSSTVGVVAPYGENFILTNVITGRDKGIIKPNGEFDIVFATSGSKQLGVIGDHLFGASGQSVEITDLTDGSRYAYGSNILQSNTAARFVLEVDGTFYVFGDYRRIEKLTISDGSNPYKDITAAGFSSHDSFGGDYFVPREDQYLVWRGDWIALVDFDGTRALPVYLIRGKFGNPNLTANDLFVFSQGNTLFVASSYLAPKGYTL